MMQQIFILVSFFLGTVVGSLVTYVFMGRYFSDAMTKITEDFKTKTVDDEIPKHGRIKSIELSASTKITIGFVLMVIILIVSAIVVVITDIRPTTAGEEKVQESLGKQQNIDSINSGLKKGVGGY